MPAHRRTGATAIVVAAATGFAGVAGWAAAALLGAVFRSVPPDLSAAGPDAFAGVITAAASAVLAGGLLWLGAAVFMSALAESSRLGQRVATRAARALTPRRVRLLVRLACGVAVATPISTTAHADQLAMPDRPSAARQTFAVAEPAGASDPVPAPELSTVVRPGDTLWSIAAAHLPAGASDAEIAQAWPVWFAVNRGVIGDDPHLIRPGTALSVPIRFRLEL